MNLLDAIRQAAGPDAVAVEVRSAVAPPLAFAAGLAGDGNTGAPGTGAAALLLRFVRPAVTVQTPFGEFRSAPYGEPDPATWRWRALLAGAGVVVVVGLAGFGAACLLRKVRP